MQINNGLYFLHEHPWSATSWNYRAMQDLVRRKGVRTIRGDMCTFDMRQEDGRGIARIKKPTGFLTNSEMIAKQLSRRCTGGHRHIPLVGGRAKQAQIYPDKLCVAIITGLVEQMIKDERITAGGIGSMVPDEKLEGDGQEFWDDLSGEA